MGILPKAPPKIAFIPTHHSFLGIDPLGGGGREWISAPASYSAFSIKTEEGRDYMPGGYLSEARKPAAYTRRTVLAANFLELRQGEVVRRKTPSTHFGELRLSLRI
jgi:hypothetical protein